MYNHARSAMGSHNSVGAFSLVELLVVVAIIVILLSLAAVAFDRAIYSANLARCAANLAAIAKGASSYAAENKARYPHRASVATDWGFVDLLARDAGNKGGPNDDRPRLRTHIPMDALVDPLGGDIKVDDTRTANGVVNLFSYIPVGGSETGTEVLRGNYGLLFSIAFFQKGGAKMARNNERLTIDGRKSTVLAGDGDAISRMAWWNRWAASSHADKDGRMQFQKYDNQGNLMWSEWARINTDGAFPNPPRGPLDLNYAFKDGSVQRYPDVEWNAYLPEKGERMIRIPRNAHWGVDPSLESDYLQIPRE